MNAMKNRPKKVFPDMKATMDTKPKEPYETPAVLDIHPVSVNVAVGDFGPSNEGGGGDGGGYIDDGAE